VDLRNFLPTTKGGIRMSALVTSSLLVVIVLTAVLLAWWRTILKVLAVTVLLLTSIGMAEVMSALIGGLTSH
jgi:hypothetical protein